MDHLKHRVQQTLSGDSKIILVKYLRELSQSFKKVNELNFVHPHPYQAFFKEVIDESKSHASKIGLKATQNIISDIFSHDSLTLYKFMNNMSNACFQDDQTVQKDFDNLLKLLVLIDKHLQMLASDEMNHQIMKMKRAF